MATLGYHALTDEWLVIPWQCEYPGRLSIAEARNVLKTHGPHGKACRIRRTAKRVLARLIDAPTVRAQAFAPCALTFDPPPPLELEMRAGVSARESVESPGEEPISCASTHSAVPAGEGVSR